MVTLIGVEGGKGMKTSIGVYYHDKDGAAGDVGS